MRELARPSFKLGPERGALGSGSCSLSITAHSVREKASSAAQSSALSSRGRICKHHVEKPMHSEF